MKKKQLKILSRQKKPINATRTTDFLILSTQRNTTEHMSNTKNCVTGKFIFKKLAEKACIIASRKDTDKRASKLIEFVFIGVIICL
jgi:hypothetical protein